MIFLIPVMLLYDGQCCSRLGGVVVCPVSVHKFDLVIDYDIASSPWRFGTIDLLVMGRGVVARLRVFARGEWVN